MVRGCVVLLALVGCGHGGHSSRHRTPDPFHEFRHHDHEYGGELDRDLERIAEAHRHGQITETDARAQRKRLERLKDRANCHH